LPNATLGGEERQEGVLVLALTPNLPLGAIGLSFDCWAPCLSYSWRHCGLFQKGKTGKMQTRKRKMNRKERK